MTLQDMEVATEFFRAMLEAMTTFGGHALQDAAVVEDWCRDRLQTKLRAPNYLFLVAETQSSPQQLTGFLEANVDSLHPVFFSTSSLHISAIYVTPDHRRMGVARLLMEAALNWGREQGCTEADLHVLQQSPAKSLYQELGFEPFEVEMRRGI
jgi:GNAT superfamily N-acetyltransferase